ncbi:MAG: hypothetical protein IPK93_12595 [Solirubrobacterales bacterium]|nr:hypothetical protein [Solirubrobacterales bacterium]
MRAEFWKIRSMPTPMWCLVALLICFVLGFASVLHWGPGEGSDAADLAVGLPTMIASIVFGVWIFGVEFGQKTLRQVLTADPRRGRLILNKLVVMVVFVAGITALLYLLSFPLYNLASTGQESIDADALARAGLAAVILNLAYALLGFAFALITASMAGGITMALVFIFVIDTVVSILPWGLDDYAMGPALGSIADNVAGHQTDFVGDAVSQVSTQDYVVVIVWLVVLIGLGSLRLFRSEVK